MRKLGLALLVLLVAVIGIVAIGELEKTDEDAGEPVPGDGDTPAATAPSTTAEPEPEPGPAPPPAAPPEHGDRQRAGIEQAVALYIEERERQPGGLEGLPTSDELSIETVRVEGATARVRLVGGARMTLERTAGRWRVTSVTPAEPTPPQPPSGTP